MPRLESAMGYPAEFVSILQTLGYELEWIKNGMKHWQFSNTLQEIRVGEGYDVEEWAGRAGIKADDYSKLEEVSIGNRSPIPEPEELQRLGKRWELPENTIAILMESAGYETTKNL